MAPSPSERLLQALIKADTSTTSSLSAFLANSHASHAALSAYASAHPAPLGDVLRQVEASLRGVHEAVRGYVGAMEMWTGELGEVKEKEEEVGQVRRDRDILVTRLIKATKVRPASTHGLLPSLLPSSPHSSVLSLPSPSDTPKLANAQAELQACEAHLAQRQRALEDITKAAIARGVLRRCTALEELAEACRTASGQAKRSLDALVPARYQNGNGSPYDKPLPNPSPYVHRPPPRAASPSTDSLSPSQSASQIAQYTSTPQAAAGHPPHASAPHLPRTYSYPSPGQQQGLQRQSTDTYRPSPPQGGAAVDRRLSLTVPPAHAISANLIPDSRLLPPPEIAQAQPSQFAPQQQQRPQSMIQPPGQTRREEGDSSGSEEHGPLVVRENPARNLMSFPTSTPPQLQHHQSLHQPHPPLHTQQQQQQQQTPTRMRTISSTTPSRRQSKHIPLPSTQSDLGPRGPPPAVQISSSPYQDQTNSLPRPRQRPGGMTGGRRPSIQSLDSYDLPTRQAGKKRGFFGTIARALHIGSSRDRDGRESPPYGYSSGGGGWGKSKGGWNTRTDRRIKEMHGWSGRDRARDGGSSDDEGPVVAVENPRGGRPMLERWGSGSTNNSGGGAPGKKRLTRGGTVKASPPRAAPGMGVGGQAHGQRKPAAALSPSEALENRLDIAARARTFSTPGPGAGAQARHMQGQQGQDGFTRMRTISEASGTGQRRSMHEAGGGLSREGTLVRPSGAGVAGVGAGGLGRSGTMKSTMSNATSPPGAGAMGGGLSRNGTVKSTMSAPPGSSATQTPGKKKSSANAGAAQRAGRTAGVGGSPNIMSMLDGNESGGGGGYASGGGGRGGSGLVEVKAPQRVVRSPEDGLISVKAPAPGTMLASPSPLPAPAPMQTSQSTPQGQGRTNGATGVSRHLSTSTTSTMQPRPQRAPPPGNLNLPPAGALSASGSSRSSNTTQQQQQQQQQHVHHTPVPSASAPMPTKSALRTRSPSPEPPRQVVAPYPPAMMAVQHQQSQQQQQQPQPQQAQQQPQQRQALSSQVVASAPVPRAAPGVASAPSPASTPTQARAPAPSAVPAQAPSAPPAQPQPPSATPFPGVPTATTPVAVTAALPTVAQPRPQPPDGTPRQQRPASAGTFGTSGDDASAYETGLEDMDDSASESEYSGTGTPGQGTPRMGVAELPEEQSTPTTVRPTSVPPVAVAPPAPAPAPAPTSIQAQAPQPAVVHSSENESGMSESTAVASDKPARRKSVRLDVPPSLTPTPATETFPDDPWKVNMEDLANAVPSRSYLSATATPQQQQQQHTASQPSSRRTSRQWQAPPLPEKGPGFFPSASQAHTHVPDHRPTEDGAGGGWHTRASRESSGDSSDEEDAEYARVKRELEEANRHLAQAGRLSQRRR